MLPQTQTKTKEKSWLVRCDVVVRWWCDCDRTETEKQKHKSGLRAANKNLQKKRKEEKKRKELKKGLRLFLEIRDWRLDWRLVMRHHLVRCRPPVEMPACLSAASTVLSSRGLIKLSCRLEMVDCCCYCCCWLPSLVMCLRMMRSWFVARVWLRLCSMWSWLHGLDVCGVVIVRLLLCRCLRWISRSASPTWMSLHRHLHRPVHSRVVNVRSAQLSSPSPVRSSSSSCVRFGSVQFSSVMPVQLCSVGSALQLRGASVGVLEYWSVRLLRSSPTRFSSVFCQIAVIANCQWTPRNCSPIAESCQAGVSLRCCALDRLVSRAGSHK